jgi:sugar/nucleoside kinase (ribokinase family)
LFFLLELQMSLEVVGLGNALMDALVVVEDDRVLDELGFQRGTMHPVSHEQWTDVFNSLSDHDIAYDSGGSCANTIATIGLLGGSAVYRGQVGDDKLGHLYAKHISDACGDHDLNFTQDHATGKCLSIISAKDAERTMLTDLGASVHLDGVGSRFSALITEAKVAHFTGYTFLPGPMQAVAFDALSEAKAAGITISIDAADPFVIQLIRDLMWETIEKYADIIFLNHEEAKALTDLPPEEAAHHIAERAGVTTVIVKMGAQGSVVLHKGTLHKITAKMVKAIDTTGAGDAYAGGYLYGHINDWAPIACGTLASHIAGLTVSQVGAVLKDKNALQAVVRELS